MYGGLAEIYLAGSLAFSQTFQRGVKQHTVSGQEEDHADQHLEAVIHQRNLHPMLRHKRIGTFIEGDKEEGQRIADIPQEHGAAWCDPPLQQASQLGVLGYARNLDDGSVEVLAWGEPEKVEALIAWLKAGGPRSARVDSVRVEPHQPSSPPRGFTTG